MEVACPNDDTETFLPVPVHNRHPVPENPNVDRIVRGAPHPLIVFDDFPEQGDPGLDGGVRSGRPVDHPVARLLGHNGQMAIGVLWGVIGTPIRMFVVGVVVQKTGIEQGGGVVQKFSGL